MRGVRLSSSLLAAVASVLLAAGGCSLATDFSGLSKDFGKADGGAAGRDGGDAATDRGPDRPDAPGEAAGDGGPGTDGARDGGADGGGPDAAADGGANDGGAGDGGGGDGGGDGGTDGSSGDGGGCPTQAAPLEDSTLELLGAAPSLTGCSYTAASLPTYYAAVDTTTFAGAAACGACIRIQTEATALEVKIVDVGPGRWSADRATFVLNQAALQMLLPDGSTFLPSGAGWTYVPCSSATSGMMFTLKDGSSGSYAATLIQNHRYPIAQVEYRSLGVFRPLTRTAYNYWEAATGMGGGPFTLRMTDIYGQMVEQSGIPSTPAVTFHGQAQFPLCPATP